MKLSNLKKVLLSCMVAGMLLPNTNIYANETTEKTIEVVKRKEVAKKIKEAREQGDISENAEYDAAKNEQRDIETRIDLRYSKFGLSSNSFADNMSDLLYVFSDGGVYE